MKKTISMLVFLLMFAASALWAADDYIIGDGDLLYISVWGVKELSLSVKVRPDGKITVPAIGDVKATGLTPPSLQALLKERLKAIVRNPTVDVIVQEINNSKVFIFGGGVKPGVHDLNRRTTLLELLCQIGEVRNSDLRSAYLMRKNEKVKQDFYKLFIEGDVSDDIIIKPNDIIFLPVLLEKNIYVMGAVNTPRLIEYREGITVMEAILEAGGFTKFAKQNGVIIFRKDGQERKSIYARVEDLTKKGDLAQNVRLQAGDYVVVKEGLF